MCGTWVCGSIIKKKLLRPHVKVKKPSYALPAACVGHQNKLISKVVTMPVSIRNGQRVLKKGVLVKEGEGPIPIGDLEKKEGPYRGLGGGNSRPSCPRTAPVENREIENPHLSLSEGPFVDLDADLVTNTLGEIRTKFEEGEFDNLTGRQRQALIK